MLSGPPSIRGLLGILTKARLAALGRDLGLELAGAGPMEALASTDGDPRAYALPELPAAWNATLDSLRPPRKRDEAFWEWRVGQALPADSIPGELPQALVPGRAADR